VSTLVILAAGLATRYGGDKQLESVGPSGELLLEYALHDAWLAGCRHAVLVTRAELRASLEEQVVRGWGERMSIEIALQRLEDTPRPVRSQRLKPWGTAHALLAAASHVHGDVVACNADDYYGRGAFAAVLRVLEGARTHAVAGYPLGRTLSRHGGVSRAVCVTDPEGRLLRVQERTGLTQHGDRIMDDQGDVFTADTPVSMNLWALRAPFLHGLRAAFVSFLARHEHDPSGEFRIPDEVNERVRKGEDVRVVPVDEQWFGMTYAPDRAAVRAALAARVRAGEYPRNLRAV
jgi:NDP-sugar pyrophosphorylase family protein